MKLIVSILVLALVATCAFCGNDSRDLTSAQTNEKLDKILSYLEFITVKLVGEIPASLKQPYYQNSQQNGNNQGNPAYRNSPNNAHYPAQQRNPDYQNNPSNAHYTYPDGYYRSNQNNPNNAQ